MSRFIIVSVLAVSLIGVFLGAVSRAAESASLLVTVTPGTISVSVNAASFDYGAMPLGSAKTSTSFVATNNGNVSENFLIKGADAVYAETAGEAAKCANKSVLDNCVWSLFGSPGTDSYRYTFTPAGGVIHTDFESHFIKAEVIGYNDLIIKAGTFAKAREMGLLRTEGKEYVVQDGDIIEIKHSA